MNAGIVLLKDGVTPCIAYDEPSPYPVKEVEFNRANYNITLVYDKLRKRGASKFTTKREETTFDFPLDRRFADLILKNPRIAVACLKDGELLDLKIFSVKIVSHL